MEEEKIQFEKLKSKEDLAKKFDKEVNDGPNNILIILRFPNGERMQRKFLKKDKI